MTAILVLILRILMVLVLYAFLVWVCVILWKSLKASNQTSNQKKVPSIILTIQEPELAQEKLFNTSPLVLGRSPNCDLVMDNHTVSANHAILTFKQNNWWIEDHNSMNGTQVNQIALIEPIVLASDDVIQCGQINIKVRISNIK